MIDKDRQQFSVKKEYSSVLVFILISLSCTSVLQRSEGCQVKTPTTEKFIKIWWDQWPLLKNMHAKFASVAITRTHLQVLKILHFQEGILLNGCYDICRKIPEKKNSMYSIIGHTTIWELH